MQMFLIKYVYFWYYRPVKSTERMFSLSADFAKQKWNSFILVHLLQIAKGKSHNGSQLTMSNSNRNTDSITQMMCALHLLRCSDNVTTFNGINSSLLCAIFNKSHSVKMCFITGFEIRPICYVACQTEWGYRAKPFSLASIEIWVAVSTGCALSLLFR